MKEKTYIVVDSNNNWLQTATANSPEEAKMIAIQDLKEILHDGLYEFGEKFYVFETTDNESCFYYRDLID